MTKILQGLSLIALFAASIGVLSPSIAKKSAPKPNGALLFQQNCASCHAGGDNKVKPSRPIVGSKELSTLANFKSYLSAPPGHMPYYEHVVNDEPTLKALYKYCKELKKPPIKQASL